MPTTHVPKYPVVDHSPTMGKVLANFTLCEYLTVAGLGIAGNAVGWLGGQRLHRKYNSKFLMTVGLFAGVIHGYLGSTQRFMGLEENASEVAKFGAMSKEECDRFVKRGWQGGAVDLIDTYTKGK